MTSVAPGRRHVAHVIPLAFFAALAIAGVARAADTPQPVTYSKDVAPIFQAKCQNCHHRRRRRADAADDLRRSAAVGALDQSARAGREMPPWHLDKTVGIRKYKNDISLTDKEIATMSTWVDGGALQGNPADMPPARNVRARRRLAHRQARSDRADERHAQDVCEGSGLVDRLLRRSAAHRGSLHQGDGDPAGQPPHRASRRDFRDRA